jgi:outer membrane lipoprotein-sorting protein
MRTTSRCLALVVAILSFALPLMAQPKNTDATSILNDMFRVYSRLASYQDEGILITTNDEPTGGSIEKMPFKTFFKRPNLFRFEWTEFRVTKLGRTYMVWFNGKEAFTYWEPDRYEKEESLGLAVAGATGVSSMTVNTVSSMLLPDELGNSILKRLTEVSLAGEELFEGVTCYRIKATERDERIELWIGKNDFLLRKLRRESKKGDVLTINEETRRKIQVDQSISEIVFNYKPPIALTPSKDVDVGQIEKLLNPGPPVWTEFRSDEGRFSVLMPDKPVSETSSTDTPQGRFEQHAFLATHSPLLCMAAYMDFPKQVNATANADGVFDGVRDGFIKQVGAKLASESPLSIEGHPGREIKAHMFRGQLYMRLFLVGDRMYMLSVMNMNEAAELEKETRDKFFNSFKLTPIPKPIAVLSNKLSSHSYGPVCN